jgi:hypothetical protein
MRIGYAQLAATHKYHLEFDRDLKLIAKRLVRWLFLYIRRQRCLERGRNSLRRAITSRAGLNAD